MEELPSSGTAKLRFLSEFRNLLGQSQTKALDVHLKAAIPRATTPSKPYAKAYNPDPMQSDIDNGSRLKQHHG
ncbi:hypothetical protein LCGC14_1599330 [marine sediment metagenome]|uniref:Uncharacterized protein n=1 Tax=marine sediment metagenome TaxID=412755 RepID=A0A0F9KSF5_9ZZZZ